MGGPFFSNFCMTLFVSGDRQVLRASSVQRRKYMPEPPPGEKASDAQYVAGLFHDQPGSAIRLTSIFRKHRGSL